VIQKVKRFGETELKLLFELEQRKNFIFTIEDAKSILGGSAASVWNVIKRLKKKKRIIRLQKGTYLFAPLKSGEEGLWSENAFIVVPYLVGTGRYYIGFLSAMNYWGMTEQVPQTVYVALDRQKRPLEAVQTRFVFVKKPKLGDITRIEIQNVKVNIASKEQAIIDGLLFPQYCLGIDETAKAIHSSKGELDWEKLIAIAKKEKSIVRRRLGYLLDALGLKQNAKKLEEKFVGFNWLDPRYPKRALSYSKKWGLKINVAESDLLGFMRGY